MPKNTKKLFKNTHRKFYNNDLSMNIFKKCCKHGNFVVSLRLFKGIRLVHLIITLKKIGL